MMVENETLGTQNGREMAEHDCYDIGGNPHTKGTKAHADFERAFNAARSAKKGLTLSGGPTGKPKERMASRDDLLAKRAALKGDE